MCTCEFCNTEFTPRPQVKNPRACSNCQKLRQRSNEKSWRTKHLGIYDSKYHKAKRAVRQLAIRTKVKDVIRCIKVGGTLLGLNLSEEIQQSMIDLFFKFLSDLGIRHANKFWPVAISS